MQVKVTRAFQAVRPGDVYPVMIDEGVVETGRVAAIALELKCGVVVQDSVPNPTPVSAGLDVSKQGETLDAPSVTAKAPSVTVEVPSVTVDVSPPPPSRTAAAASAKKTKR